MEVGKDPTFGSENETLNTTLESKPLELSSNDFVTGHLGFLGWDPAAGQRTSIRLGGTELAGVLLELVVAGLNGIICNVDHNDFSELEFLS